jgi:predicted MFS family arabinose efflux permease
MEICAYAQIWALIFLIPLIVFPNNEAAWTRYAILTLLLGYPYIHAIQVGLQSRNANSVRTRTVASAAYNMMVQLGNIVSSNIYRADDAPYYRRGNKILVAIACLNLVLYVIAKGYYLWKNKKRARVWNNWTEEERKEYLATTKDRGNKRVDFQFAH